MSKKEQQSNLKIILGDLRHKSTGKHSCFVPIGMGYISSYALSKLKDKIDIEIYTDPDEIIHAITSNKYNILGLSNYSWNTNLSQLVFSYAKTIDPNIICVAGGPELPFNMDKRRDYLLMRKDIDFYVYGEGEMPFFLLLEKILTLPQSLLSEEIPGIISIQRDTSNILCGSSIDRLSDLDYLPSPYLTGILDKFLDGSYAPSIETTRGCPYSCAYCVVGKPIFNKINRFSIGRIKDELYYIAKKMKNHLNVLLLVCDSNFCMYKQDEEIVEYMAFLFKKFNWPNNFCVTTGKSCYDRIIRLNDLLDNKIQINFGMQSLNPDTLDVIKRSNLKLIDYTNIAKEMRDKDMSRVVELIVPLPMETKETFFNSICYIIENIQPDRLISYTTIMLKGTVLYEDSCRNEYDMRTRFRILPRQFGTYAGERCFEIEEVCISTKSLNFDDYLEVRGLSLIVTFFCGDEFDFIHRHLKECDISVKDYIKLIWHKIASGESVISSLYRNFIEDTQRELYDSEESIISFYSQEDNYKRLESGQDGDNLIRKYYTKFLSICCSDCLTLVYECIIELCKNSSHIESLLSAKQWMLMTRDISHVFDSTYMTYQVELNLSYDVFKWYKNKESLLLDYKCPVVYNIEYDVSYINEVMQSFGVLYSGDVEFRVGKVLTQWNASTLWAFAK